MFETGLHITSELAVTWLPWLCLAMIMMVGLSCALQPQYLRGLMSNSFASFSSNAAEQIPSIGSQAAQWVFNSLVPAIVAFTLVADTAIYGAELISQLIVLSVLIDLARALTGIIVSYTFRLGKLASMAYMRYFSLRTVFSFVLFVIMLLLAATEASMGWLVLIGVNAAVYMLLLGIQWARLFCNSLLSVVSLITYILTVELLPTLLLFEAGRQLYLLQ